MKLSTTLKTWMLLMALAVAVSCSPEVELEPNDDDNVEFPDNGNNEQTPDDNNSDDSNSDTLDDTETPEDPDNPDGTETPEDPDSTDGTETPQEPETGERPEPYYGVEPWGGIKATDSANDSVGSNEDFYHELNSFPNLVVVTYSGTTATVTSTNSQINSYIDGAHVALDMATNGVSGVEVILVGETSDGSLKLYSDNKLKLSLYGVDLTSQRGPAINSQSKKRIYVDLAADTTNRLTDCAEYQNDIYTMPGAVNEDRKGALFAEGNIILSGEGVLVVAGKQKHAIVTDGCFYQRPGVTVAVTEAAKNAIHVKGDSDDGTGAHITGGAIVATVASTAGKGIKCDMDIVVAGGVLDITTSGDAYYDSTEADTSSAAALKSDYNIIINGGNLALSSSGKGGKGINADGGIEINGGNIAVSTSGTRYTYSSSLTSSPKGIKADGDIVINGGVTRVTVTGKSEGSEGMESKASITMNGGEVICEAYDDGVNAAEAITVNEGRLYAYASNNDGIDSNGTFTIYGGLVIGVGGSAPEAGIDVDNGNNFKVNGGVAIGFGAALQSTPSTASTQCSVAYGGVSASQGSRVALLDSSSMPILVFEYPRTLSGATLFVSSPDIVKSSTYTFSGSGTLTGYTDSWQGWYEGGTWSGGTTLTTFTPSSVVTTIGSVGGGPGGPGGGGGGRPW